MHGLPTCVWIPVCLHTKGQGSPNSLLPRINNYGIFKPLHIPRNRRAWSCIQIWNWTQHLHDTSTEWSWTSNCKRAHKFYFGQSLGRLARQHLGRLLTRISGVWFAALMSSWPVYTRLFSILDSTCTSAESNQVSTLYLHNRDCYTDISHF